MEEMPSEEFTEWQFADARSEIPDDRQKVGMIVAAVMNSGFRYPKNPVGWEDFWPKPQKRETQRDKDIKRSERLIAARTPKEQRNDMTCAVWTT